MINRYKRIVKSTSSDGRTACVDVYDVLEAFDVTCPAIAHAVKKLLCCGDRGHKDKLTDLDEARAAILRATQLEHARNSHD